MPDPTPVLTVAAGTGMVNATALDGVITSLVAKVNELIEALGTARGEDRQLANESLRPRMMSQRMIGAINEMIAIIAAIRRQYRPSDTCVNGMGSNQGLSVMNNPTANIFYANPFPDLEIPVTLPAYPGNATPPRFYRVHGRVRLTGQRPMYMTMWTRLRGTVTLDGTTVVLGVGSQFTSAGITIGDLTAYKTLPTRVRINGEIRNLVSVADATHLTIDEPFSFTGAGFTIESDSIMAGQAANVVGSAMMLGILRDFPAGAEIQNPMAFSVVADDDVTDIIQVRGREAQEIVTASPAKRLVLQWAKAPDPTRGVVEFYMLPGNDDYLVDFIVETGSTFTVRNISDDNGAVFTLDVTKWPLDDDPRFPMQFHFPCRPSLQFDVMAVEPWEEDDMLLLTEAGFPINGEAPTEALFTDA